MCVKSSVIPSVFDVEISVGIRADGCVSDMRALRDVRKAVGDSVGISVGIRADGRVSDMRALRDVRKAIGDSVGIGHRKIRR